MRFQCDRCGKRYSTGQPLVGGRTYTLRCRSCGHKLVVRAPAPADETVPLPAVEPGPEPDLPTTLPPPSSPHAALDGPPSARADGDTGAYVLPPLPTPIPAPPPTSPPARLAPPAARTVAPEPSPVAAREPPIPPPLPSRAGGAPERTPPPAILPAAEPPRAPPPPQPPRAACPAPGPRPSPRVEVPPPARDRAGRRRTIAIVVGAGVAAAAVVAVLGTAGRRPTAPAAAAPVAPVAAAPPPAAATAAPPVEAAPPAAIAEIEREPPPRREAPVQERAVAQPERGIPSRTSRREPPRRAPAPAPAPAPAVAPPPRTVEPTALVALARPIEPAPAPQPELRPAPPPPAPARAVAALPPPPPPPEPEPEPVDVDPAPAPAPARAAAPAAAASARAAPAEPRSDLLRLLLRKDVDGLGRSGETVDVPQGYARNFLLPKGLAVVAPARRGREAPQPGADGRDDEPVVPGAGWRRPIPATPQCVERSLRVPDGARAGTVTVKFAVGRTGVADLVQVSPGPDWSGGGRIEPRLVDAVSAAVRSCRFTPGADEQGRPARLWTTMSLRVGG